MKNLIFTFLFVISCPIVNGQETSKFDPWYVRYPLAEPKVDPTVLDRSEKRLERFRSAMEVIEARKKNAEVKASSVEVSLYDKTGNAKAYITSKRTIYLWNGSPVAYIFIESDRSLHIYGFNGKHLGWAHSSTLYDNNGYAVCALKSRINMATFSEMSKLAKFTEPSKSARESVPARPVFTNAWSNKSLEEFFCY